MDYTKISKRTAITRKKPSLPSRYLIERDAIKGRTLDYGCGKGLDAEVYGWEKYDPNYAPEKPDGKFETIVCNYVLNVLPDELQRQVLTDISNILTDTGRAFITVRRDPFKEGFSKLGTYQTMVYLGLDTVKSRCDWCMYTGDKKSIERLLNETTSNGK